VESVAWVSELKDLLSGLFFLLSLLAYRAWVARPSPGRYGVLLGCFALALMAKPMAVTLPLVLLLLDAWPLARLQGHWRERLLEKVPLLVLALLDGVLTVAAQGQAGAMVSFATTGVATRVANAALNPWRYLADTFWPAHLAIFHPIEPVRTEVVTLSLFALGLVTVLVWLQRRVRPYLAVGWLWYLGMLLPVLGIIQVGNQAYADRYTYLPSLGILLAVVWGVADRSMPRGWPHRLALGMAFLGLAASATASRRQISYWRDTKTLYRHALAVTPDNATAECTLGVALLEADSLSAAIGHLERALVLQPGWVYAEANLGVALLNANHPSAAIPHLERAATSMPSAMRYDQLGFAYAAVGRLDDAEAQLSRALRLEPTNAYALIDMGQVLAARGRVAAAESLFQRAAAVAPTDESVRRMLAVARASVASGRFTMRW
jgi:tetratricopeptide (TPR) repeat protein